MSALVLDVARAGWAGVSVLASSGATVHWQRCGVLFVAGGRASTSCAWWRFCSLAASALRFVCWSALAVLGWREVARRYRAVPLGDKVKGQMASVSTPPVPVRSGRGMPRVAARLAGVGRVVIWSAC